jgi:carbamate kinase
MSTIAALHSFRNMQRMEQERWNRLTPAQKQRELEESARREAEMRKQVVKAVKFVARESARAIIGEVAVDMFRGRK